jgi:hypothetical protein
VGVYDLKKLIQSYDMNAKFVRIEVLVLNGFSVVYV